jgi:hypothetical protein
LSAGWEPINIALATHRWQAGRMNLLPDRARAAVVLALLCLATGLPVSPAAAQTRPDMRISDASALEGRDIVFTVELTGPHPGLSVDFATSDGTALAGQHYVQTSGTLSISANRQNSLAEIRVPTLPDHTFAPDQTFSVQLSNSLANIVRSRGQGTIRNNDPFPEVNIIAIDHVREPDGADSTNAPFFVRLTNPANIDVTVRYRTESGTAHSTTPPSAKDDFQAREGLLTFEAFTNFPQQVNVVVNGDDMHEADETFLITLSDPINARLGNNRQAVVRINNNDLVPTLSIGDLTVTEGNAGQHVVTLKASLTNPTDSPVTFSVSSANGTAIAPFDYVAITDGTSNTILVGALETSVPVTVVGDELFEPTRSLFVTIANPTNAVLGDAVGELTLTNDDSGIIVIDPPFRER